MKKMPAKGQIIDVLWQDGFEPSRTSWYRGKVSSIKPVGTRVVCDDGDITVHNFHSDSNNVWRPCVDGPEDSQTDR